MQQSGGLLPPPARWRRSFIFFRILAEENANESLPVYRAAKLRKTLEYTACLAARERIATSLRSSQ